MSVTNPERVVTKQDLADFYDELLPFISPKSYAGFTPIGTIIPMIAESAPANYLICNGATYNKSDYPELAAHLLSMTSYSMYVVSGDNTKFKVPDLRGEFLRGTGTNSHAYQGSGAAVGVHQDATEMPRIAINYVEASSNNVYIAGDTSTASGVVSNGYMNTDSGISSTTYADVSINKDSRIIRTGSTNLRYTGRPTNTSVLFCIAVKNIYLDPKNDYSTEEKVIGTWINNEPLYQRTLEITDLSAISSTTRGWYTLFADSTQSYGDVFVVDDGSFVKTLDSGAYYFAPINQFVSESQSPQAYFSFKPDVQASTGALAVRVLNSGATPLRASGTVLYLTIRYTKTT